MELFLNFECLFFDHLKIVPIFGTQKYALFLDQKIGQKIDPKIGSKNGPKNDPKKIDIFNPQILGLFLGSKKGSIF